LLSNSIF